ncbi:MAG: hypothetical protein HOP37_02705 [Cyclobacteriaceae bacterium]|nr:hypothetical protein [Cyclobacteriaceae bacterium]
MKRILSCIVVALSFLTITNNVLAQTCASLDPSGFRNFGTTFASGVCSQVSQTIRYQFGFNVPTPAAPTTMQLAFDWGDGSPLTVLALANSVLSYDVTRAHSFPVDSDCEYLVRASIFVNGSSCPATQQQLLVAEARATNDALQLATQLGISAITG